MGNDDLSYKDYYADLVAASTSTLLPEDGFTTQQFAHDTGKSRARASEILRDKVDAGTLKVQVMLLNGHNTKVFRFLELEVTDDRA